MADIIQKLKLTQSPIGGFFKSTSVSTEKISNLPKRFIGERNIYSSNYYLLPKNQILELHKLNQDELWFFHSGSTICIHIFPPHEKYYRVYIGGNINNTEESLNGVVPHNVWFGAELIGPDYGLVSCSLSPGFDPRDSFLPSADDIINLKKEFPSNVDIINLLTSTTIVFIRHGEVYNPKDVYYGRLPCFPLSEIGIKEADAAGKMLERFNDISIIYHSPLQRAVETAEHIQQNLKQHQLQLVATDYLNEVKSSFDGISKEELKKKKKLGYLYWIKW